MPIALSEQNLQWQKRAREVAEDVVRPLAEKYDRLQEYPWEIKAAMAEAGLFGVIVPDCALIVPMVPLSVAMTSTVPRRAPARPACSVRSRECRA